MESVVDQPLPRWRRARTFGHTGRVIGAGLLVGVVLLCVFVPLLWPYGPNEIVAPAYQAPSWSHPFGTDTTGRDVFVRTFAGGRLDLAVAAFAIAVSCALGTAIGTAVALSRRRWVDTLTMRLIDGLIAFPFVVLILALIVVVGPGLELGPLPAGVPALLVSLLLVGWAIYARLGRAEAQSLRQRDYVLAAELLGYSRARVAVRHVLPEVWRITAAYAVADVILVVVVMAGLAFLGAGVQPPTADWGQMMYEGRTVLATSWWITVLPGVVLVLTGLGVTLVADSLLGARERGK
ncbi:MAG TPA: ABC transporter permease [Solirubrobacterales bacterium]|nr:ABC transporter permease [Solirubrobacterales bacterium]